MRAETAGDARKKLLAERLRRRAEAARATRIERRPCESAPLSAAQERIWLLYEFDPGSPVFNRPLGLRLRGPLSEDALRRSLDQMVRRHEALRTVFPVEDGAPVQRILPPSMVPLDVIELTGGEAEARTTARAAGRELFDLRSGPLLRARLLRLAEDDHVLLVLMHHIAFDGWSENVFVREFSTLYQAFARDESPPLPEPPIQYADFARWQREQLDSGRLESQIDYWAQALAGAPGELELPADRAARADRGEAESVRFTLAPELSAGVRELAKREKASPFMVLLATFQLLLARMSGQDEVVVGSPVAGRTRLETEPLIGCFMNIVVLRARVVDGLDFRAVLAQVRETALAAFEHQQAPFEHVVARLNPPRSPDRWPLFQAMFHLRNLPNRQAPIEGALTIERFQFSSGLIGGLDLSLEIQERAEGFHCDLSYDATRFGRASVDALAERYRRLLAAFVTNPELDVRRAPLLSSDERRRIVVDRNQTAATFSNDRLIHDLFDEAAAANLDEPAVLFEGGHASYGRLRDASLLICAELVERGVGVGDFVAVAMERSPWMIAALLGVMRAGAAYVPLDPQTSGGRLRRIADQARLRVAVVDAAGRGLAVDQSWDWVLADDRLAEKSPARITPRAIPSGSPAYAIFTSGSTGEPKGVVIPHRALANHLLWRRENLPLASGERQLQRASFTFDDSVWEIFQPLVTGAATVLVPPGREADGEYILSLIEQRSVTAACFVPSQLAALADEPGWRRCRALKRLTTGAEVLPVELAARIREALPERVRIYNGYGPTEATVACSYHEISGDRSLHSVPIGRPIANAEVYVLDRALQPVPDGVAGEIAIGGAGLALGYLRRPGETAVRFVAHPFRPGERIYKTGDRGRFRSDGELEFLGRIDRQVQVRGYRIEPGEIEAALERCPEVRHAAVQAWSPSESTRALAAYVVPNEPNTTVADLKARLIDELPSYMIPADWILLDELPRTASGKPDLRALPKPTRGAKERGRVPASKLEADLARLWAEALELPTVGPDEDFFELGGHSLPAVKLFSRIRKELGVELPLAALFEAPTVAALARKIAARAGGNEWRCLVPLRTSGARTPLFWPHANGGDVLFLRDLAEALGADQPFYALRSPGLRPERDLPESIEQLAALYVDEMRSAQPRGPYRLAGFCMGAYIALEAARRLADAGETVEFLGVVHTDAAWRSSDRAGGIRRHLEALAAMPWASRRTYLAERARYRRRRIGDLLSRIAVGAYESFGVRAPDALWRRRLRAAHIDASRRYEPRAFPGPIVYFEAEGESDFRRYWEPLAEGGLQRRRIDGRGVGALRSPNVEALAKALGEQLASIGPTIGQTIDPKKEATGREVAGRLDEVEEESI